ncbi:MAG: transglutaminase domain-containing protein [Armatimonadetes bacterium]|nr:transglutaminase domain-containing protein [Armatimonadota bacterium]
MSIRARAIALGATVVAIAGGALWWAAARRASADITSSRPEISRALLEQLAGTHWYRVSVMGSPSGWMFTSADAEDGPDGKPYMRYTTRMQFQLVLNNTPLQASNEINVTTDSQLRPVKITMVADELGRSKTVRAEVMGSALQVEVEAGGKQYTRRIPLPPDWGSDLEFVMRAAAGNLKPGDRFAVSIFDPQLIDFDRHHITVGQWRETEIGGQKRRVLEISDETEKLKLKSRMLIDADGVMWRQEVPGILNMVLEKVTEEEAKKVGHPLSLTNRVEVDKPLPERPESLASLTLAARLENALEPPVPSTERQQVSEKKAGVYLVRLTAAQRPSQIQPMPPAAPADVAEFLGPTPLAQCTDQDIQRKASEIVAGAKDSWDAATRIVRWVYANLRKVASEPRPVSAAEVLQSMTGDCTEHAVLAGTLARAAGLPSKMCVGLAYTGGAFYYHAWVKIWVGDWAEMDPTWGELLVDPSHILVADGNFDEISIARMSLATARTIGQLKISIIEARPK